MSERSIESKDISVVFQGPITQYTAEALRSVRKHLPDAEIILATWKGIYFSFPEPDLTLLLDDPKGVEASDGGFIDNINRMIFSSKNGILASSRKYILKMRTDCILQGTNFLHFFNMFPKREKEYCIFSKRILIPSFFTRPPKWKKQAYLYHPSDWASFGLREDMIKYWDVPLVEQPSFSQFFKESARSTVWSKFFAEQYVFIACMEKLGHLHFLETRETFSDELANRSQHYLFNNFTVINYITQFDFVNIKYNFKYPSTKIQTFSDFLLFYSKNCDPEFIVPLSFCWKNILGINNIFDKICFHLHRIKRHRKRIFEVIGQSLGLLFHIIHFCFRALLFSYRLIIHRKGYKS